jgi:hypothetical protein
MTREEASMMLLPIDHNGIHRPNQTSNHEYGCKYKQAVRNYGIFGRKKYGYPENLSVVDRRQQQGQRDTRQGTNKGHQILKKGNGVGHHKGTKRNETRQNQPSLMIFQSLDGAPLIEEYTIHRSTNRLGIDRVGYHHVKP